MATPQQQPILPQTSAELRKEQQPGPVQPTPVNIIDIINVLADKANPLVTLLTSSMTTYQNGQAHQAKFQTRMALVAVSVVFLVVGVSGFLTYIGKVDGSTFTFLLGLIVGYVLTFIRDQITGPE